MNIQEIIDLDFLQKVQDSFAEATGLAAITVDFRGNPVTKYSNFSPFCRKIREDQQLYDKCLKCDAYGGLEAVRRETFFVYRCHTGLVDLAVPIIIKGQFIGSMLVGQVKLNEIDNNRLDYITKESTNWLKDKEIVAKFDQIPTMSIEKITAAAQMMFYVINNMVEKDVVQYVQEELRAKDQELINQLKVQTEMEKSFYDKQKHFFNLLVNPNLFFNVINTMSCLAILEKASRTQEVIVTFSDMMKYLLTNNNTFVTIEDELFYIEKYVALQKLRFEDRVQVSIDIPKELRSIKIPAMVLQSIIDNAYIHGFEPKDGKGIIQVKGYLLDDDFVCEVIDDGLGMPANQISGIIHKSSRAERENQVKGIGLYHVNFILTSNYGNEYKLEISQNDAGGTTVKFRVPK